VSLLYLLSGQSSELRAIVPCRIAQDPDKCVCCNACFLIVLRVADIVHDGDRVDKVTANPELIIRSI
jgi:hypothetical protein